LPEVSFSFFERKTFWGITTMLTSREHREQAVLLARQAISAKDAAEAAQYTRAATAHLFQAQALEREAATLSSRE
jgi:hypothetical protein